MDEDILLDYIEFHLSSSNNNNNNNSNSNKDNNNSSSSSTMCELSISAGGEAEKIISGFFKPFLSHIHAIQELYEKNSYSTSIRLEKPHIHQGRRPWFTKKTINRLVEFVSSPEVLERVKTIEDELLQLEQVRNIQASNLIQMEDPVLGANPFSTTEVMITPSEQNHYDPISNEVEASKWQLVKAMDIRLRALQQEQNLAFSRAAKAGFDYHIIEDLMSFAEFFRADRLCRACIWFFKILRKRQQMNTNFMEETNEALLQSNGREKEIRRSMSLYDNLAQSLSDELLGNSPPKLGRTLPQRTPPRRRSMSPLKKVQVGKFGSRRSGSLTSRSINYFSSQRQEIKERNSNVEASGIDNEEYEKGYHNQELQPSLSSKRLSVQAAISLFEGKHKDPNETLTKQRSLKQETSRISSDSSKAENVKLRSSFGPKDSNQSIMDDQNVLLKGELKSFMSQIHVVPHVLQEPSICSFDTSLDSQLYNQEETLAPQHIKVLRKINSKRESYGKEFSRSQKYVESTEGFRGVSSVTENTFSAHGPVGSDQSSARSSVTSIPRGMTSADINCASPESTQYATPTFPITAQRATQLSEKAGVLDEEDQPSHSTEEDIIDSKGCVNVARQFIIDSCNMPSDSNMKALASMINHSNSSEDFCGRRYEHYTKLRNAKMMDEHLSKRAEREAKLKLMEETLDLRKAEMHATTAKLSKEGKNHRVRALELADLKENPCNMHKSQILSEENSKQSPDNLPPSPPSPPLTPRATKESAKLHKIKKASSSSKKSATTPRNSMRASSISPRSAPTGTVSCFSDLKKENSKLPSKSSLSSHMHPKNDSISKGVGKDFPLESMGAPNNSSNRTARKNTHTSMSPADNGRMPISSSLQEEVKPEIPLPAKMRRNAVAPIHEVKSFPQKGSNTGHGASSDFVKVKKFSIVDVTTKSSDVYLSPTPVKGLNEDAQLISVKDESDYIIDESVTSQKHASMLFQEMGEKEAEMDLDISSDAEVTTDHSDGGLSLVSMYHVVNPVNTSSVKHEELLKNERPCPAVSFRIESGKHKIYNSTLETEHEFNTGDSQRPTTVHGEDCAQRESSRDITVHEGEHDTSVEASHRGITAPEGEHNTSIEASHRGAVHDGEQFSTISKLIADSAMSLQRERVATGSTSFHATLVCDELTISNQSSMENISPEESTVSSIHDDHRLVFDTRVSEPSMPSPASWDSSCVQYTSEIDAIHTHKKWINSSQKPVVVVPPKEPAKGLKRLLKFARKSRGTPEVIITDCLSATITSGGDDYFEDPKAKIQSVNDLLKLRTNDRMLKEFSRQNVAPNGNGDRREKESVQLLLRSSIPTPPSNFKLRDDHVSGSSTRLKAPRSFFSLPNFRSRGREGKSV